MTGFIVLLQVIVLKIVDGDNDIQYILLSIQHGRQNPCHYFRAKNATTFVPISVQMR